VKKHPIYTQTGAWPCCPNRAGPNRALLNRAGPNRALLIRAGPNRALLNRAGFKRLEAERDQGDRVGCRRGRRAAYGRYRRTAKAVPRTAHLDLPSSLVG
jgi:hypothetical protein